MGKSPSVVRLALALSLGLALVACASSAPPGGGSTASARSSASASFPVVIGTGARAVTIPSEPRRIVSLSPTATEMLFAIGAGDQVVAVDDQSNYPAQAPTTKLSGYEPNAEAIAGYDPDLVVYANDLGDVAPALAELGVPALMEPAAASLRDAYAQIDELGRATGHESNARALVSQMRARIARIVASVPTSARGLTYYHELDDTYYSVTSKTFIGRVYALFGLRDIADAAAPAASGYPQLSPEYILRADPDLIFLADTKCCGQSPRTVARRPGWQQIAAVRTHAVVALDDDVASRWGPRIVDFVRVVARAITRLAEAA
jgi:iron complex transport system substrate-binding protein